MAKSQNKTVPTDNTVEAYLDAIDPPEKQADCRKICDMMTELSGEPAQMWGNIVGFGQYHYKYESGREGDFLRIGFAARSQNISIYIMPGYTDYQHLLDKLGKHKKGKSCLYIKRLSDVDVDVLKLIIQFGLDDMDKKYPRT